ncbi:TcpE family conjugal transfer membrane protein [Bacillus toyonensis]|uniref:TcpE family conjugal transfer membrane protein n=1 Tax=Bacillus toyonensis TaxID=155322 RepID=UPI001902FAC4|nr:TcpE family conjugal transfer membrane protein [Bacillus toyonensis]QQN86410.1 conjugal transfer protein [Bacillus toyonensis]
MTQKPTHKEVRTYNSIWDIPKSLYGIRDLTLPFPVPYRQLGFFVGSLLLILILDQFLPLGNNVFLKYLILPGGIAYFFGNVELDGKSPLKFLFRFFVFMFESKKISRYKDTTGNIGSYQYKTLIRFKDDSINNK